MDEGLKVTVTPAGWPLADNAIAELKPPETVVVMVEVTLLPWLSRLPRSVTLWKSRKLAEVLGVTVRVTVKKWVTPSPQAAEYGDGIGIAGVRCRTH